MGDSWTEKYNDLMQRGEYMQAADLVMDIDKEMGDMTENKFVDLASRARRGALTEREMRAADVLLEMIRLDSAISERTNKEIAMMLVESFDFPIDSPYHALIMEAAERICPELSEEDFA